MKKKQEIFLQHSPLRKSPRLTSVSSSTQFITKPKSISETLPDANADYSWALSLDVLDPLPLKICFPSHEEGNSVRRSSRFTTNKYRTPVQERSSRKRKALSALDLTQLRRSSRLSSSSSSVLALTSGNVKNVKRCRSEGKEAAVGPFSKKVKSGLNEKNLRRLSVDEKGNSSNEFLALPEPGLGSLSEGSLKFKCLRSRTALIHVGNEKEKVERCASKERDGDYFSVNENTCSRSSRIKRALIESPQALERSQRRPPRLNLALLEPPSVQKSTSVENCLRSRTVLMHAGKQMEEKIASKKRSGDFITSKKKCLRSQIKEYALIELSGTSKNSTTKNGLRMSPRLNEHIAGERLKSNILALPEIPFEKKNAFSEEQCLRSRKMDVHVEKQKEMKSAFNVILDNECLRSPEMKSALDELSEVSENRDMEECDSEVMNKKCLRSRKIQFKVTVESAEKKGVPIEEHACKEELKAENIVKLGKNDDKKKKSIVCSFTGVPIPEEEAQKRWRWRYELKSQRKGRGWKLNAGEEDEIILNVDCHYAQAKIGSIVLKIGDCAFVKGEGRKKHVGRILEFFKTMEGEDYFRIQWFFRAEDTVLKDAASLHDKRRLFYSTLMNDNILDCIISKVNVVKIPPTLCLKSNPIQSAAFYYDMEYCVEYSTFRSLLTETSLESDDSFLSKSIDPDDKPITPTPLEVLPSFESFKPQLALLDLYSGCGGMSTGLCVGAKLSNVNLVTKWAVDCNSSACDSLKLNHPETQVRNESADDFLELLKRWEELCKSYICDLERTFKYELEDLSEAEVNMTPLDSEVSSIEYEVSSLVDICYGDPCERGKRGLQFKVRWKGYGPDEDTWEPIEGLSNCQELIQEFVRKGFKSKILPLPGDADVICGGPPCQGISGYNRYRNFDSPLEDERNHQIVIFMNIVEFLKPKYVLMENVVDIIRFDKGSLGRYSLSRLVYMKYQARLGTIASGCYGLPQFRLRVFIWGAHPSEKLPQFPLPTHDVVVKYWPPLEFERNIVAYDEGQPRTLEEAIVLRDAISELPAVTNYENCEEMAFFKPPETEFQNYIRLSKDKMMGLVSTTDSETKVSVLYDHRPLPLSEHDYLRVCQIPRRKGANFRDLPGLVVGEDNVVRRDPTEEPVMLPTGRPLIPDSTLSFEQGKSKKPYARLWWDETVSTIVTFPHVRSMAILHPEQDRILTIRECARLQGFPDFYRFCGTIKERYCQIGNAVSIPVARALGYALGTAYHKVSGNEPLMTLPPKFFSQLPSTHD